MEIIFWESASGRIPVIDFIESLPPKTRKKILRFVEEVFAEYGMKLIHSRYLKKLRGYEDLYELRISHSRVTYRILLLIIDATAWLLQMFDKKTNSTPRKHLDIAYKRSLLVKESINNI